MTMPNAGGSRYGSLPSGTLYSNGVNGRSNGRSNGRFIDPYETGSVIGYIPDDVSSVYSAVAPSNAPSMNQVFSSGPFASAFDPWPTPLQASRDESQHGRRTLGQNQWSRMTNNEFGDLDDYKSQAGDSVLAPSTVGRNGIHGRAQDDDETRSIASTAFASQAGITTFDWDHRMGLDESMLVVLAGYRHCCCTLAVLQSIGTGHAAQAGDLATTDGKMIWKSFAVVEFIRYITAWSWRCDQRLYLFDWRPGTLDSIKYATQFGLKLDGCSLLRVGRE
jgi:hypothetical protein